MPTFPAGQSVVTTGSLRYEDVAQDGRIMPIALPPQLGSLWRDVLVDHLGARNAIAQGVIPILTRLTVTSLEQPIRVDRPVEAHCGFALAHDDTRIFMNVWCELRGAAGRITRRDPGALALAGTVFAEHVFTRPLAPPDQRRVTRLDVEGYPAMPELHYPAPAPTTAQEAPDGAQWLDELAADATDHCLTLDQTDSNQHVNSLVYIRVFLDAAARRVAARGQARVLSRAVDIAYRKPCFAGDRVRAHLRLFDQAGRIGAAGFIAADDGKPRCYVRTVLGA